MKAFKENIKKYDWAKSTVKNAIAAADERLDDVELLCKFIVGNTLPKAYQLRYIGDQNYYFCTYCGADVETKYGGFEIDSVNKPWKIQCPECKRLFPSNDFELLYERGLDEHGVYNAELAKQRNAEAVARGEKDALVNELYSDLYNPASESYNKDPVTGDVIDGKMWGVDDGWGYKPGRINEDGNEERHHYIALFLETAIGDAMSSCGSLATAYLYTDEEEYGRAAAIILDRFADVYPEASIRDFHELGYPLGGVGQGMFRGSLRDCTIAANVADYIDMVFPLLEQNDEKLIKTLSEKVDKLQLDTPKENGAQIWEYWKKNILIRNYEGLKTGDLRGNLGYQERVAAMTAVALDTEPYSKEIVEWIFKPALVSSDDDWDRFNCEGGNILHNFVNWVDRDGMGSEGSPNYNLTWTYYYDTVAGWLESYDNGKYSLYKNPKFMQMYLAGIPLVLTNNHHPQIGDSGSTAMLEFFDRDAILQRGFYYLKDSPIAKQLAEYIYFRNGNSVRGLHYDMYTPNPESMQHDVLALVGDKQTIEYNESGMVAGYGFAALRDGEISGDENTPTYKNTLRDFYMWFGKNDPSWSHNHLDALNIGVEAYGLNMAPDLGYSESSNAPSRYGWNRKTISHNTVMVNEKDQIFHGATSAPVLHFDSSDGEVQLMDVDAANSYAETSIYRRTVVMINAGPDVSYGVDFFRVKGGENHTYSLHAQSDSVYETEGLGEIHYQTDDGTATGNYVGSYGSPDIEYGPHQSGAKFPGSTWMKNVRQAYDVNKFSVDFDITDFRKVLKNGNDLHLRLTMLNDFTLDEVALTSGHVSQKTENLPMPDQLEYVLARRGGENLDSLFTTVIEPYKGSRYLLDMSDVDIETEGEESEDDTAKAIKVIRKGSNGEADRVDYFIY
ncbi:MAG: heparinase II/III family protein, partial [Oscillospiraceae bacterium]|nr:heparinase II/III family protein [Oscillospiraceae bacterium]